MPGPSDPVRVPCQPVRMRGEVVPAARPSRRGRLLEIWGRKKALWPWLLAFGAVAGGAILVAAAALCRPSASDDPIIGREAPAAETPADKPPEPPAEEQPAEEKPAARQPTADPPAVPKPEAAPADRPPKPAQRGRRSRRPQARGDRRPLQAALAGGSRAGPRVGRQAGWRNARGQAGGTNCARCRRPTLERAMGLVRELFAREYAEARTDKQRSDLARKLVQHAEESADDPAGQYALPPRGREHGHQGRRRGPGPGMRGPHRGRVCDRRDRGEGRRAGEDRLLAASCPPTTNGSPPWRMG